VRVILPGGFLAAHVICPYPFRFIPKAVRKAVLSSCMKWRRHTWFADRGGGGGVHERSRSRLRSIRGGGGQSVGFIGRERHEGLPFVAVKGFKRSNVVRFAPQFPQPMPLHVRRALTRAPVLECEQYELYNLRIRNFHAPVGR